MDCGRLTRRAENGPRWSSLPSSRFPHEGLSHYGLYDTVVARE